MPVAFDAQSSGGIGNSNTLTIAHTCSGTERVLLVGVEWNKATSVPTTISSITYNGIALTPGPSAKNANDEAAAIWYLINPATGANSLIITFSGNCAFQFGGLSYTGVNQTSPISQSSTATGTSTTPSVALTAVAGGYMADSLNALGNLTLTPDASQTQRWNQNRAVGGSRFQGAASDKANPGSYSMKWTASSSSNWVIAAVALQPPAVTPTTGKFVPWIAVDL